MGAGMTRPSHLQEFDDLVEGVADIVFDLCAAVLLVTRAAAYAAHVGAQKLEAAVWGDEGKQ